MRRLALLLLSGCLLCGGPLLAQETTPEKSTAQDLATPSALGVRQQRVIRMMQDLERKFTTLSQTLEKTEPERAERLVKAFQQSKQLLIEDRMASIVKLLNEARLDPASDEQGEIISDLKSLINLLLEDDDWEEKQEEIAQLEQWRERVKELLEKERELRDESDRVSNKDQTLADLQKQIKALEGIIKKQEELVRATESSRERGAASLSPVADRQHKVRGETEQLADNVGGKSQEDPPSSEGEAGGERQPGGEKSGGEKSAGGQKQPGGEKAGGEKAGGEKAGGEKAGGEKAGGEKAGGEKSGQPGGEKSGGEGEQGQPSGGEKSGGEKSAGGGEKSGGEKSGAEKSGQPGGEKSGGEQSGGQQSGGQQSGGQQSGGQQSGGQQSGEQQSGPSRPGEESLRKAAEHQQQAESELGQGKGEPAQEDQQKALVELNKALEELKQEHSRIAKLPPEMFDELAGKQEKNSRDTGALEDEIAKAKTGGEQGGEQSSGEQSGGEQSGGEQSGGQQSGGQQSGGQQSGGQQSGGQQSGGQQSGGEQSGGQQPGQEDLKEAKQAMDKAADDLKKKDPSKAGKNQDEAIEKLKQAIKEIEERLAQLREETQLEKLARLEQRFREMLNLQENASKATIELHAKRDEDGKLKRSDRLALAKVAEAERVIAELARLAEEIIVEDGTSVVFPRVTEHLRTDLNGVAGLLDDQRTDKFTQTVQGDIEQTLRELIEALQKAQKQQEGESGGGGGGGGGGMEEPLLPSSAELKLLRSAQLRVNRRTKAIDEARDGKNLDDTLRQELEKAAQLQREITELTEEILEKF